MLDYNSSFLSPFLRVPSRPAWRPQPTSPPCSRGLGSLARPKISPTPPLPAPPSLLEPRWHPAESITFPCHSCCPSPLCCYLCCSPAPSPYVSTPSGHAAPADLWGLTLISDVWKCCRERDYEKWKNAAEQFCPFTELPPLLSCRIFVPLLCFVSTLLCIFLYSVLESHVSSPKVLQFMDCHCWEDLCIYYYYYFNNWSI